jgi:citrate synthase
MSKQSFSKGLEGVIADETSIGFVDSEHGQLYYRGYTIGDIVEKKSFDECAFMILNGHFPTRDELQKFDKQLAQAYSLPGFAEKVVDDMPKEAHPMEVIQSLLPIIGSYKPWQIKVRRVTGADGHKQSVVEDLPAQVDEVTRLLARIPTVISRFYRRQQGLDPVPPRPDLPLLANFLYMLHGREPSPQEIRVFEVCQMLQIEHGMNASTFAARVVASTLAPIHACLSAAVGALYGILHGGADEAAFRMARDEIKTIDRAETYVRDKLAKGGLIMGLGHRIYKTVDPRAKILKRMAADLSAGKGGQKDEIFKILVKVEDTATNIFSQQGKEIYANVEFFKGAVFNALDIPPLYYTSMFVMARSFAWGAHIIELWHDNRIYRPEALYVGELNLPVPA